MKQRLGSQPNEKHCSQITVSGIIGFIVKKLNLKKYIIRYTEFLSIVQFIPNSDGGVWQSKTRKPSPCIRNGNHSWTTYTSKQKVQTYLSADEPQHQYIYEIDYVPYIVVSNEDERKLSLTRGRYTLVDRHLQYKFKALKDDWVLG